MYCFIVNKLLMKFGGSQSISSTHVPGRSNGNSVAAASFGTSGGSENTVSWEDYKLTVAYNIISRPYLFAPPCKRFPLLSEIILGGGRILILHSWGGGDWLSNKFNSDQKAIMGPGPNNINARGCSAYDSACRYDFSFNTFYCI